MWFWLENHLRLSVRPGDVYENLRNYIIYMQILKWASSILERTDGDQWFSVLPKDCHTFEFSIVEGLNQDFYCCHGCVCLGKIGEGKKKKGETLVKKEKGRLLVERLPLM